MSENNNDTNDQFAVRAAKLANIREKQIAYPNTFRRKHLALDILNKYQDKTKEELEEDNTKYVVAGRIIRMRQMGKASFISIQDMSSQIQVYVTSNDIGIDAYHEFKTWDLGDIIGVEGNIFRTKMGELTVQAQNIELVTKSLRPLPDKWHGLSTQEERLRRRYVDLIVNEKSREVFQKRFKIIKVVREFLQERNFLEVETPMMQVIPGGASARPFVTHHNALDMELFLRIAPELYLKRLVVGGLERVFELNRNFRNEGLSTKHNPEFTMLEFYQAYADYKDLMDLTESLFKKLAIEVNGSTTLSYQGIEFDFAKEFKRLPLKQSLLDYNQDLSIEVVEDKAKLTNYLESKGINVDANWGLGKLQFELFEATVEDNLLQPTFITEYPAEVSPLARSNDRDETITDRFEFFIAGQEIANGFSELNDPHDQAARFKAQVEAKEAGDLEAMYFDEDYIEALEYAMPPTAGEGIGIDRLVMLFTDSSSIKDVILFPHLRHKSKA